MAVYSVDFHASSVLLPQRQLYVMDLETEVYSGNSQKAVQRYTTVWKVISLFVLLATTIKITTFCPNMTKISAADHNGQRLFCYFFWTTANIKLLNSGKALVIPFSITFKPFLDNSSSKVLNDTILHDVPATIIVPDS